MLLALAGSSARAGAPQLGAHPRLFLGGGELAKLKALASQPGSATARVIALCDDVIAHPASYASGVYQGIGFPAPAGACALTWRVRGDQASGAAAVKYFKALLDDYSAVGAGDGGDNVVQHDSGYSMRVFAPYAAIDYDWLQDAPGMTPDLLAHARERFKAWTTWYAASGYHNKQAGANYNAGYIVGDTLIAVAEADEAGADGDALWDHVVNDLVGGELAPALKSGGVLDGGDWLEGWQYGPLSVSELAMSARALRDAGVDTSAFSAWESQLVLRALYAQVPDKSGAFIGGDADTPRADLPVQSLTLDAALLDNAGDDEKAYAQRTILDGKLSDSNFPMTDAIAEANAPAPKALPATAPTWFYAPGSSTLYARTGWSTNALWMASRCASHRIDDHMFVDAGNIVLVRGGDHLIVDPTPYGGMSTLTTNAPTVASPQLPSDYQPSQGFWGSPAAVDFRWARQTQSGVIAARCDYAGQYAFQETPPDVSRALRDVVMVPYGSGNAAMIVVDDTVGATSAGLDVRFHAPAGFAPSGAQARAHVGGSDLIAQAVVGGAPAMVTPPVGDCFSSPRGQCTTGRFATGEWHLAVPTQTATAVTVLDAVAAGEAPAVATSASGSGWRVTELDRAGKHLAVVKIDAASGSSSVTYTAGPGTHVVIGAPAGSGGKADVTASKSGAQCAVTVAAHSGATGGFDAKPVVALVGSDCSVTEDPTAQTASGSGGGSGSGGDGGGGGSGSGSGVGSGSGSDGGSGSDAGGGPITGGCSSTGSSSSAPLGLVGLALFGVRRRRRERTGGK